MLKENGYASAIIKYIQTIINNNKLIVTEEEKKNPVIFKKEAHNLFKLNMSTAKSKQSAITLSGGNFDFRDSTGEGYYLRLTYTDHDEVANMVIRVIREAKFACVPGRNSASCFLESADPTDEVRDAKLQEICTRIEKLAK